MSDPFNKKRRQQFLLEAFYNHKIEFKKGSIARYTKGLCREDNDVEDISRLRWAIADEHFEKLSLHYTAGEPIEPLRDELAQVIYAYERYQQALAAYEEEPEIAPLGLDNRHDYERCMQLIGLCYLLHRRDLLPRISALIDPGYEGEDTLYEDLLAFHEPERFDIDEWYFDEPYTHLIDAMYEKNDEESTRCLAKYCKHWYPAFKGTPWHDGHLRISGTEGDYFGYWAFEAGAAALLCNIDDASIDHMVYPKDLVAWARANEALSKPITNEPNGRCLGGQPCPSDGLWFTPADNRPSRYFKQGEIMPDFESTYGSVIWQRQD